MVVPAVLLLGLSTSHKVGLALAAAGFAGFSLIVSMLVPRWRPQFPGRGLPLFLVVCVLMFFGMLAAVFVLGKESEPEAAGNETTSATQTTETGQAVQSVSVSEVELQDPPSGRRRSSPASTASKCKTRAGAAQPRHQGSRRGRRPPPTSPRGVSGPDRGAEARPRTSSTAPFQGTSSSEWIRGDGLT